MRNADKGALLLTFDAAYYKQTFLTALLIVDELLPIINNEFICDCMGDKDEL